MKHFMIPNVVTWICQTVISIFYPLQGKGKARSSFCFSFISRNSKQAVFFQNWRDFVKGKLKLIVLNTQSYSTQCLGPSRL